MLAIAGIRGLRAQDIGSLPSVDFGARFLFAAAFAAIIETRFIPTEERMLAETFAGA